MDKNISDTINKLESILKEIDEKISFANKGYLKNEEAKDFIIKVIRELDNLLPKDSIPHRRYLRLREEKDDKWWKEEKTTFVTENNSNYRRLFNWQDIIKEILKICDPEALAEYISKQNNYYYSQGNFYEAKRMVIKIMRSANNSIVIIDPYLDDIIFNYIDLIDVEIDIKLVTSQIKKMFKELLNDLKNIRKNIDARQSEGFHDRYIIIDGKEIWNLGTSINYIGKNAFQINKVTGKETIDKVMNDYNLWWQNGKDINC
jgi:hypothetical protein